MLCRLRRRSLAAAEGLLSPEPAGLAGIGAGQPNELNDGICVFAEEHKGFSVLDESLIARHHGVLVLVEDEVAATSENHKKDLSVVSRKRGSCARLCDGKHLKTHMRCGGEVLTAGTKDLLSAESKHG